MMPCNKMDFADECSRFMIPVRGVIVVVEVVAVVVVVVVAPIVAINSWLKTQKMSRRIKQLEERAHESFNNDSDED